MFNSVFVFLYLFGGLIPQSHAQERSSKTSYASLPSTNPIFELEEVAKNLGIVWGMVFINSNEMLFTELDGHFKKLDVKTKAVKSIQGSIDVYVGGQGGLLDIAIHPNFSKNKRVYFSYSKKEGRKQTTGVSYGILKGNHLIQIKEIFSAKPAMPSRIHFGSRLVFNKEGLLFITVGDRYKRHFAQKLDTHLGKILRVTDEGKAPSTNPFISNKKALPEIWSMGHRNPQGLYIHPTTDELWANEHGPRGGDEINLIKRGKNYGWPIITYGREYWGPKIGEGTVKKGLQQPVKYYVPSIAPSGLLIYSGKQIKKWEGDFFSGALALQHLNRVKVVNNMARKEEVLISQSGFRVRDVIESPEGHIYISIDRGKIFKIKPVQEK